MATKSEAPLSAYVAYLGLFVLAAGLEGEFAANAYYPRLRMLIGEPMGSTLPSFDLMHEILDDLERWSNYDKHTELGIFTVRVAGSWKHVGLPIAQTILTEHERRALPAIFANANLNPISPPSNVAACALHAPPRGTLPSPVYRETSGEAK